MPDHAHSSDDFEAHKRTYAAFITGAKWSTGIAILVLVLMSIFLL